LAFFQGIAVSWYQCFVRISELLLWIQDGAAPAADATNPAPAGPAEAVQEGAKAAPEAVSPFVQFAPILIIGFFFYFILLRPQQKEQRRRQDFLTHLKKNCRVVTTGGMIGTVVDISSDGRFVTLRVDDTTRVRFLRSAIQGELDDKPENAELSSN
jgi:preprotein translocase subunit YajC